MKKIEQTLDLIVERIVWGCPLLLLIIIVAVYFTIRTRFVTIRYIRLMPKLIVQKNTDEEKMSAFQSITLILANHLGTGNIIGVASAILYGGPGSILYMCLISIIASSLSFAENTLGQMYKTEINQEYRGGPAYYILKGLKSPFWAHFIAFGFFISLGHFMPTIQAATITTAMHQTFQIPKYVIGIIVTLLIGIIIIGKSKRIVLWAEVLVPFMSIFYMIISIIIILINVSKLDDVLLLILSSAFNRRAMFGGIIGSAINFGIRRGLFSNEAGLGSAPNILSSANVKHPAHQGLISAFSVFIDTVVMCTITAIVLLITDSYNVLGPNGYIYQGLPGVAYEEYVQVAVGTVFKQFGSFFVGISIFLFGFTALFSGYYNSQTNLIFLFKKGRPLKIANTIYQVIFLAIIFISSIYNTTLAWKMTDIGVGLAYVLHLFVLLLLSKQVVTVLRDFEKKQKNNDPTPYQNDQLECWGNKTPSIVDD